MVSPMASYCNVCQQVPLVVRLARGPAWSATLFERIKTMLMVAPNAKCKWVYKSNPAAIAHLLEAH